MSDSEQDRRRRKEYVKIPVEEIEEDSELDSSGLVLGTSSQPYVPSTFNLRLRFNTGQDLDLLFKNDPPTIYEVKMKGAQKLGNVSDPKMIRLIYRGKILSDEANILELINKANSNNDNSDKYGALNNPLIIQAIQLDSVPIKPEDQLQQIVPKTGFDRLLGVGFSEGEINELRTQFHMMNNIDVNTTDPEEQERIRQLEEAWIDNTNQTLPDGTVPGTYIQILQGMTLGFFGSILVVPFCNDRIFTKYAQLGLLFGVLVNIGFGCILMIH